MFFPCTPVPLYPVQSNTVLQLLRKMQFIRIKKGLVIVFLQVLLFAFAVTFCYLFSQLHRTSELYSHQNLYQIMLFIEVQNDKKTCTIT